MLYKLLLVSILLSVLGSGVIGGVFFAFSNFVMKALAALPPAQGIDAMRSINVTVLNGWFLGTFLGTGAICILIAGSSFLALPRSAAIWVFSGSALYLFGTVLVTIVFNVPRNDALANVDPASPDSIKLWTQYVREWTAWNHVRTAGALAAAASFIIGLYFSRTGAAA